MSLHLDSRTYAGFQWRRRFYVYNVLPFGMATAPRCFAKVMGLLVRSWRASGIRMIAYLDDWLFVLSRTDAQSTLKRVLDDCRAAHVAINLEKSHLTPVRRLEHLGFEVDLDANRFRASPSRWDTLQGEIREILRDDVCSARQAYRTAGRLVSLGLALGPAARIFTRHLYAWVDTLTTWDRRVPPHVDVREELLFWAATDRLTFTNPILAAPARSRSVFLAVDASDRGWGAYLLTPASSPPAHGFFSPAEREELSTHREVRGLLRCLHAFEPECTGASVFVKVDNQNVGRIAQRGSARPGLTFLAQYLFRW